MGNSLVGIDLMVAIIIMLLYKRSGSTKVLRLKYHKHFFLSCMKTCFNFIFHQYASSYLISVMHGIFDRVFNNFASLTLEIEWQMFLLLYYLELFFNQMSSRMDYLQMH